MEHASLALDKCCEEDEECIKAEACASEMDGSFFQRQAIAVTMGM